MLKHIPDCISPELLKRLHEMGHGDRLVIGDANFPANSLVGSERNIRCDGLGVVEILDAVLHLMPLDDFVSEPVLIMDKMDMHKDLETPIWDEVCKTVKKYGETNVYKVGFIDRFRFYEEAKKAHTIVSTTEKQFYACIILQKGCL